MWCKCFQSRLYELQNRERISLAAASKLLSNMAMLMPLSSTLIVVMIFKTWVSPWVWWSLVMEEGTREESQFSLHVYSSELTWFVCNNFLHCYYTYMYLQELVQGYTVGFWFFSYAYALNFINHCFGSLFWQGSLLGPYFTKSWVPISNLGGPY